MIQQGLCSLGDHVADPVRGARTSARANELPAFASTRRNGGNPLR